MTTPTKCVCGAERLWVYEGRIAFKCGTLAMLPLHGNKRWRVRRSLTCVIDHCWQHQKPFYTSTRPLPRTQVVMECSDFRSEPVDYIRLLPDNNGKPWTIDDLNRMKLWATPDRGIIVYGPDGLIRE